MIITIEGTDGSGKATQSKLLYETLTNLGNKCKLISFPNYSSASSTLVKMYLNGEFGENANCLDAYQASTLFAVDRLATMKNINIEDYDYIILDRYTPSNMIHQACKTVNGAEREDCLNWLNDFEYGKLKLPKPDAVLFLDLPIEISLRLAHNRKDLKNGQSQDIHEKDKDYMCHAYNQAKYVAKKYDWTVIDCCKDGNLLSVEQIHNKILKALNIDFTFHANMWYIKCW